MVDIKKFVDMDLYGLLDIEMNAVEADIRKAYRRKALSCHPDKNPDNPKAAELFQTLSKALEILLDSAARTAYDRVINGRKAAKLRNKQLDSKRQKLKSDLERREQLANNYNSAYNKSPEDLLKDEIERLMKEGSRLLEEEQLIMQKRMQEDRQKLVSHWDSSQHRIKIKWIASKSDTTNGGYNESLLRKFLQKYGDIIALVLSSKKCGSALVEFNTQDAAEMAVAYEKGLIENPLTLEWLSGSAPKNHNQPMTSTTISDKDYESLVLRQMRQAEERKRLIEQMMKDDGGNEDGTS